MIFVARMRAGGSHRIGCPISCRARRSAPTLTERPEQSGAWLLHARELFGTTPEHRSRRNGRGPLAWQDHCLVVPWVDADGELTGMLVVEDPVDRLLPRDERRHALRLLVDLAASLENTIAQRARLHRLASRDTLTGLRNRRGLDRLIADARDCAVILCDLDGFKQINDRYGHASGDLVLRRFAEILRDHTRESDIAIRLGGDEFCVLMIGTDREGAAVVAERIRSQTPARMLGLVPREVTVSVGLARRDQGVPGPRALLTDADRALYGAKQGGRNRTVVAGRAVDAQ